MLDYSFETAAAKKGYKIICGVDEAGRGPLAGPVYAAAVILPVGADIPGLNDSKKLSEKKRNELFDVITDVAISYAIGVATEKEIDEINILQATFLAMKRAIEGLEISPDYAIIDGNKAPNSGIAEETVVKGDGRVMSVAAASILAKVSRDRFMLELSKQYPQYQFQKHKGYGTKLHYEMIEKYGVSPVHRVSFLKKVIGK